MLVFLFIVVGKVIYFVDKLMILFWVVMLEDFDYYIYFVYDCDVIFV